MTRTTEQKQANSKGVVFALVSGPEGWEVWKFCENYSRECKGGVKKTWRYVQKGMTQSDAKKLFNRRVGKKPDAITAFYADRSASGLAALAK
jgi:hypothetical protein